MIHTIASYIGEYDQTRSFPYDESTLHEILQARTGANKEEYMWRPLDLYHQLLIDGLMHAHGVVCLQRSIHGMSPGTCTATEIEVSCQTTHYNICRIYKQQGIHLESVFDDQHREIIDAMTDYVTTVRKKDFAAHGSIPQHKTI